MALDLGTAWVQVSPSFRGFASTVNKEVGSAVGGAFKSAAKIGTTAIATIGAAVGGLALKGGIDRALSIEQAQAKLKGLGHDAGSITEIMNDALASVKGTAFGLGDAATVAASMSAAGVKSGEQMTGVLKTVADTAQISGRSLTDIGAIFGSVAARGKLQGDDMLQLMSSGVPVLQFLSDQLGVTSADVSDMVSKGQIDFATFSAAMQKGLGGAALAGGETFTGAMANVRAALSRLGETAAKPALDGLRVVFNALIPVIDKVTNALKPVFDVLANQVARAAEAASGAIGRLGGAVEGITNLNVGVLGATFASVLPVIGAVAGQLGSLLGGIPIIGDAFLGLTGPVGLAAGVLVEIVTASSSLRQALGTLVGVVGSQLSGVMTGIVAVFAGFRSVLGAVGDVLAPFVDRAADAANVVLPLLGDALSAAGGILQSFAGFIERNHVAISVLAGAVVAAATSWKIYTGAQDLARLATTKLGLATTVLKGKLSTMGAAFKSNPFGVIMMAVSALVGAFSIAYQSSETFRNGVQGILGSLAPVFSSLMGTLSGLFQQVAGAVGPVLSSIVSTLASVFSAIGPVLSQLAGTIGSVFSAIGPALASVFGSIGSVLASVFSGVMSVVAPMLTALQPLFTQLSASAGQIGAAFGPVGQALSSSFQQVGAALAPLLPMLGQQFGAILSQLAAALAPVMGQLLAAAAQVLPTLAQAFGQVAGVLIGSLGQALTQIAPLIGQLVGVLIGSLGQALTQIAPLVSTLVAVVAQLFAQLAPLVGQLLVQLVPVIAGILVAIVPIVGMLISQLVPVIVTLLQVITPIITMLISALVPVIQVATQLVLAIIQAVIPLISAILPAISALISALLPVIVMIIQVVAQVLQWLAPLISTLITALIPVITTIIQVVITVVSTILSVVGAVVNWLMNTVVPLISGVVGAIATAFGWVRDRISDAWNWIKDRIVAPVVEWFQSTVVPKFEAVRDSVVRAFEALKDGVGRAWDALKDLAKKPVEFVVNTVAAGLVRAYNWIATKFGADEVKEPHVEFANGGFAGREAGFASSPILWAEAGPEAYIPLDPAKRTRSLGIWAKTGQMLGALPMADGGIIGNIIGGIGNAAAAIGNFIKSPIEWLMGRVRDLIDDVGSSPFAQIAAKIPGKIADDIGAWVKEHMASIFGGGGSGSEAFDGWWNAAVAINPDMAPFKQIAATVAQNESGFNPNVMNNWDSNAAAGTPSGGLMQFIQPTFEAYKWPGFDNWMGAVDQILAWWKYVNARYGGPFNIPGIASLAGGGGYVGYASGTDSAASGLAWVGEQGPELVNFRGGEQVFNGQQMGGLEDAIAQRVIGLLQQLRVALIVDGHQMGQVIDGRISMAGAAAHGSRW
ncbi:Tape measure domain-containing protein [Propionibacterium freudenreichii]|uniref:tape measure protein n=1 Tax=Propionibacterium freudenreichii TaxID=1744 RepID=UPI00054315D6|nr:tape measure protein [Propionibacterium freudenreichii]CEG88939.1 Tape measure domain-containing protein [Propionibacterium freudenreichii]